MTQKKQWPAPSAGLLLHMHAVYLGSSHRFKLQPRCKAIRALCTRHHHALKLPSAAALCSVCCLEVSASLSMWQHHGGAWQQHVGCTAQDRQASARAAGTHALPPAAQNASLYSCKAVCLLPDIRLTSIACMEARPSCSQQAEAQPQSQPSNVSIAAY